MSDVREGILTLQMLEGGKWRSVETKAARFRVSDYRETKCADLISAADFSGLAGGTYQILASISATEEGVAFGPTCAPDGSIHLKSWTAEP